MTQLACPKVTIIIPNFNVAKEIITLSLNSVKNQSFTDFECIVVDDSVDPVLSKHCKDLCDDDNRFLYVKMSKRLGLAGSLNYGISIAKGKYVARFDSDDICRVDRIERQYKFLEENLDIDVLGSWIQVIDNSGNTQGVRKYKESHDEIKWQFIFRNAISHSTVMLRLERLRSLEVGYLSEFCYSEDLELWLKMISKGAKFSNLSECLVSYRQGLFYRGSENWSYNVEARMRHLSSPYYFLKLFVICLIYVWIRIPKVVQSYIYRTAVLEINLK